MPIVMIGFAAVLLGGAGFLGGAVAGAVIAHLIHLRSVHLREILHTADQQEEVSAGCVAVLASSLFGGVLGVRELCWG